MHARIENKRSHAAGSRLYAQVGRDAKQRGDRTAKRSKYKQASPACTRAGAGLTGSEQSTVPCKVLLYNIALRFVYPMHRRPYFAVADAISENLLPMDSPHRAMMCSLLSNTIFNDTTIKIPHVVSWGIIMVVSRAGGILLVVSSS